MGIAEILLVLLGLMAIGMPVAFCLMMTSLIYIVLHGRIPLLLFTQRIAAGPDSFPLLAVPFFIFAGQVMNTSGITRRIFDFAKVLVGHIPGGLGHVNVVASIIFSGMSGAAVADAGGLGLVEIKAMRDAGYDDDFTVAITASSSIIGPIIPPSIPAVIYGATAGVSIGGLFIGGVIPGLLMGLALAVLVYVYALRKDYPRSPRPTFRKLLKALSDALLPMLTPVIIIGGIWTGKFTPTESAAIAAVYAIILGLMVYRELTVRDLWRLLVESAGMTANAIIIVAGASLFGYILAREQAAPKLAAIILGVTKNRYGILLMINLFLLFVGTFMEPVSAMIILIPVFTPIIKMINVHPVHFGVMMILNLMIGLLTPPVGQVLYILSTVSGMPFERIARVTAIFILPHLVVLVLITLFPELVLFLPRVLFGIV